MSDELTKVEKQAVEKTEEMTWAGDTFRPYVDIWENDTALTIEADVPGVSKEDVELDLRDGILTISARVAVNEYEGLRPLYGEYNVGNFYRRFTLGEAVDQEKITAELNDGVLRLNLPKKDKVLPRSITIT